MIHPKNYHFLRWLCATKMPGTCLCHSLWQGQFTRYRKQVVNRLKIPRVSPHSCFAGGVKLPQGEGSAVIPRKKNDLLHRNTTCLCHSLWQGQFTCYRKQVVNRLKIPQGLSTLMFRRWSEVPSRGGVRGDSP